MGHWRTSILLLGLAACETDEVGELESESPAWADFDPFARPSTYVVRWGDTLGKIAASHDVTVEELMAWNGLEDDGIEVDQVLLVWKSSADQPAAKGSRARRAVPELAPATVVIEPATVTVTVAPLPRGPRPVMVRDAGILGALEDDTGGGAGLDSSMLDGLAVHRENGSSGLESGSRSGLAGGTADAEEVDFERVRLLDYEGGGSSGGSGGITSAPVKAPRFVTPAAKRCLAGPSGASLGDADMVVAQGLSEKQIRGALDPFVHHTSACIPAGSTGGLTVATEITVGCDGRVMRVDVVNSGGAPAAVTACIASTLSYVSFPAHDLPDGMTFGYPISYRF